MKNSCKYFGVFLNFTVQWFRSKRDEIFQIFSVGILTNPKVTVESGFAFTKQ